jgi:hypothetical protein
MCSPTRRFLTMQPMTIMLEEERLAPPSEMMMLKAVDEPMIIRHSTVVDSRVNKTAFKGISHPWGTYEMFSRVTYVVRG